MLVIMINRMNHFSFLFTKQYFSTLFIQFTSEMSEHLELKDLNEWNKSKEELIIQLTESANLLDNRHHYLCYSRIAGNTVSSIGSGMLIAGLALAPVSAGASLPALAVAGGIIGFVGNSTSMTSVVYENIAERLDMRKTKELIDSFHHNTEAMLSREASVYWNFVNMISPGLSAYNAVNAFVKFSQLFGTITDTAETGGALFTKALCTSGINTLQICYYQWIFKHFFYLYYKEQWEEYLVNLLFMRH